MTKKGGRKKHRENALQFLEAAPVEIAQWIVSHETLSRTIFELLRRALFLWFDYWYLTIGIASYSLGVLFIV